MSAASAAPWGQAEGFSKQYLDALFRPMKGWVSFSREGAARVKVYLDPEGWVNASLDAGSYEIVESLISEDGGRQASAYSWTRSES